MKRKGYSVKTPEEFYFPLRGGIDLITPAYQIQPGKMLDCFRYEVKPSGGYGPIDGFERVDGHGIPSEAVFQYLIFTQVSGPVPVGATVKGETSGAIGVAVMYEEVPLEVSEGINSYLDTENYTDTENYVDSGVITDQEHYTGTDHYTDLDNYTDVENYVGSSHGSGVFLIKSGEFVAGESVSISGSVSASVFLAYSPNTAPTEDQENSYHNLVVEALRSQVEKVPGAGPVRGVWRYNGDLYAFRDDAATATECCMYKEDPDDGWVLVDIDATLLPGGKYKFENTNFGGSASTIKMYGCDGKNKAFEFDGTIFTQIATGMTDDAPILICEHVKHLFLGFPNGSLQHSPPTDPTGTWSVVLDAGEIGMGEDLQDFLSLPGGALGVWCKDSIAIFSGTGVGTWALTSHSKRSGGVAGTVQDCGKILFLNATGIANLAATNAYGSFKSGTVTTNAKPLLDLRRKAGVTGSVSIPGKNQYRIFFADGYFLSINLDRKIPEITQGHYDIPVRCISAPVRADDELGNVYFGSDDGYVYKMDSGVSLDHEPMQAYCRLAYSHQKAPRIKKRYREVVIELDSSGGKNLFLSYYPDFSFSRDDIPQHPIVDISESTGNYGLWDLSDWNSFSWVSESGGGGGGGTASGRLDGVATEMGLMLYFFAVNTTTSLHTINGAFIYFNYLGRQR